MGFILSWTSLPWQVRRFFPSMWLKLVSLWWQPELLLWCWRWEGWKNCEFQFSAIIKQNISDRTHRRNTVFFVPFLMIGYSIDFIYYPLQYLKKATSASQPHRSSFLFIHYFHFFAKPFHKNPETLLLYNIPYFQHPMSQMYYHFHLHLQTLFQILPQWIPFV